MAKDTRTDRRRRHSRLARMLRDCDALLVEFGEHGLRQPALMTATRAVRWTIETLWGALSVYETSTPPEEPEAKPSGQSG